MPVKGMSDWFTVEQSPVPEVGAPSIVDELAQAAQMLRKQPSSPSVHHDSDDDLAVRIAEVVEPPPLKHELQWEPGNEGKGFVLTDGSVWTWPTEKLRPMHMAKSYTVKCYGKRVKPSTAFHIRPDGRVWFYGPGRMLDDEDWACLNGADNRLTPTPKGWGPWEEKEEEQKAAPEPVREPSGYGHGKNVLDILDRMNQPTANTVFDECPECGLPHPAGQPCPQQGGGPVALPDPPAGVVGALKLAAMTRSQRLRQQQNWGETFGPDQSKVVHQFPDGWTINKLDTNHAECYEGEMMPNCIGSAQSLGSIPEDQWHAPSYVGDPEDQWNMYSVRDPENLPHATFSYSPNKESHNSFWDLELEGRAGANPGKYAPYVHDWWLAQGGKPASNKAWDYEYGGPVTSVGSSDHQREQDEFEPKPSYHGVWHRPDMLTEGLEYLKRSVKPGLKAWKRLTEGGEDLQQVSDELRARLLNNYKPEVVDNLIKDLGDDYAIWQKHQPDAVKKYHRTEFPEVYWMHGAYGPEVFQVVKSFQEMAKAMPWNHPETYGQMLAQQLVEKADLDPTQAEDIAERWTATWMQARGGRREAPQIEIPHSPEMLEKLREIWGDDVDHEGLLKMMPKKYEPDPEWREDRAWSEVPVRHRSSAEEDEFPEPAWKDFANQFDEDGYHKTPEVPDAFERGMPVVVHNPEGIREDEHSEPYPDPNHGVEGYYLHPDSYYQGSHYIETPDGRTLWVMGNNLRHRDGDEDPVWNEFWRGAKTARLVDPSEVQGLTLYHGTNVPHEQIQREGLRPGDSYYDADMDQALLNHQEEPHGLYFTTDPDEARQYGDSLFKLKAPEHYPMYEVGNDPRYPDSTHYTIPASIPAQHLEPHEYDSYFGAHPVEWGSDARYLAPYRSAIPTGYQEMYHVSPRANRESILQGGLTGWSRDQLGTAQWPEAYERNNQPPGNYFFDNPEDALDYVYALHGRDEALPEEPDWEEMHEPQDTPEGFDDWSEEDQDNWYDNAEYQPVKDDPQGYDIWRAQLSGHPLAPDPETRMVDENNGEPWDLGRLHDAYEQQGGEHSDVAGYYGGEANRYYSPVDVHPSRLDLHEHVPRWKLTQGDYYDRLDQNHEREVPQPWNSLPLTERPMPGHEAGINENFFTDVMHGGHAPSQTLQGWGPDNWTQEFERHRGPFDAHIETSIPGYRANSAAKGTAILNAFPKANVLDIASSTGAWGKTLSSLSNGQIQTDNLDPNPAMVEHFNSSSQVPGARAVPQAFGESFTDESGKVVPRFNGIGRYDVVHESMGFQFISNDRDSQIAEAKRMLRPGGVFLTEQKVITPHWRDSETTKDAWKRNYYSEGDLARKNQEVGFQEKAASMMDMLVKQDDLEATLHKHFAHVAQYWSSGNFVGYAASDSRENLERYLGEFKQGEQPQAVDITPRMVEPAQRVARMTGPQEQREWDRIWRTRGLTEPQNQPVKVHEWPDGWSIQQHENAPSISAVGEMMRNCWQNMDPHILDMQMGEGWHYFTAHDPQDIPRAAWYVHNNPWNNEWPQLRQALGPRNRPIEPELQQRIKEWADSQGHGYDAYNPFNDVPAELRGMIGEPRHAGMTRKQLLEQAATLPEDGSEVVHQWPDGWSIRSLRTLGDLHREGELMGNCWSYNHRDDQGDPTTASWYGHDDPTKWSSTPITDYEYLSLRDPDNIPHVSMGGPDAETFGRHNSTPKEEYAHRIGEWGESPYMEQAGAWLGDDWDDGYPGRLSAWQPDTQNGRTPYTQESALPKLTERRANRFAQMGLNDWQNYA